MSILVYISLVCSTVLLSSQIAKGADPGCSPGWIKSDHQTCYKFYEPRKTWRDAFAACQEENGWLAYLETGYKSARMKDIRRQIGKDNNYYWVGARQSPSGSGPFVWLNGREFQSWLFTPGEPNEVDGVTELCVDLGTNYHGLNMNDVPCARTLGYLCERSVTCSANGNTYSPKAGSSCRSFWHSTSAIVPVEKVCPEGLQFDLNTCVCNWPAATSCNVQI